MFTNINKKYLLLTLMVLFIVRFSYAEEGPPPPPSKKLPIPGIAYLAVVGLYYGYKKVSDKNL